MPQITRGMRLSRNNTPIGGLGLELGALKIFDTVESSGHPKVKCGGKGGLIYLEEEIRGCVERSDWRQTAVARIDTGDFENALAAC